MIMAAGLFAFGCSCGGDWFAAVPARAAVRLLPRFRHALPRRRAETATRPHRKETNGASNGHQNGGLPRPPNPPAAAAFLIKAIVFGRWRCSRLALCFALPALVQPKPPAPCIEQARPWLALRCEQRGSVVPSLPRLRTSLIWSCLSALPRVLYVCCVGTSVSGRWFVYQGRARRVAGRVPPAPRVPRFRVPPRPFPLVGARPPRAFGGHRSLLITPSRAFLSWVSQKNRWHCMIPSWDMLFLGTLHCDKKPLEYNHNSSANSSFSWGRCPHTPGVFFMFVRASARLFS